MMACNPVGGGSAFSFVGVFGAGWCELCSAHEGACQHFVSARELVASSPLASQPSF